MNKKINYNDDGCTKWDSGLRLYASSVFFESLRRWRMRRENYKLFTRRYELNRTTSHTIYVNWIIGWKTKYDKTKSNKWKRKSFISSIEDDKVHVMMKYESFCHIKCRWCWLLVVFSFLFFFPRVRYENAIFAKRLCTCYSTSFWTEPKTMREKGSGYFIWLAIQVILVTIDIHNSQFHKIELLQFIFRLFYKRFFTLPWCSCLIGISLNDYYYNTGISIKPICRFESARARLCSSIVCQFHFMDK